MAWSDARAELVRVLETTGYKVYRLPPRGADTKFAVSIMMVPPGRSTARRRGPARDKTYLLDLSVIHPIDINGYGREEADAVDDAVEEIDTLLESHVNLGGHASVASPVIWESANIESFPPGSGFEYLQMNGRVSITLSLPANREAGY